MPENYINLVQNGLLIKNHFGWEDYNDLATTTAPLPLTIPDLWYDAPNDAQGPQTDSSHKVLRHLDLYDPLTGTFNFTDLNIGDLALLRTSLYFNNSTSNVGVYTRLLMGIGSGYQYDIPLDTSFLKKAGKHHIGFTTLIYMGNEITRNFPAKLQVMSDTANVDLEVDGWAIAVFTRD